MKKRDERSRFTKTEISIFFSGVLSSVISSNIESIFKNLSIVVVAFFQKHGMKLSEASSEAVICIVDILIYIFSFGVIWFLLVNMIWSFLERMHEQRKKKGSNTKTAEEIRILISSWAECVVSISRDIRRDEKEIGIVLHFARIVDLVTDIDRSIGKNAKSKFRSKNNYNTLEALSIYAADYQLSMLIQCILENVDIIENNAKQLEELSSIPLFNEDVKNLRLKCERIKRYL